MKNVQKPVKSLLSLRIPNSLFLIFIILFLFNCSLLFCLDFSLRPKGFLSIPLGSGNINPNGNTKYGIGGGADIGFELDLSTIWTNPIGLGYTAGIEGGIMLNPSKIDSGTNVNFYSFGGALGLYYFPLSRLFVRADGAIGAYRASRESVTGETDLFWRAGGEAGFRFTPNFLLAANAGWRQYQGTGNNEQLKDNGVFNSGMYAGLTAQFTFQTGRRNNEGINAALDQYGAVYPAFMQLYQTNPIGSVVIRNNENAEIRDVRMSFRAAGYTASEFSCGTVSIIPRGRSVDIPLLADFSNDILRFTDNGRIMGELVIRYRFLGQEREAVRAVTVASYNRNTVSGDTTALAAFISPSSPEALDFSRQIAGLERNNRRTGHNQNFSYAIHLIETMRNQIQIKNEQLEMRNEERVQFPAETLIFKSGTAKDMALLFAASLESVAISSALIQTDNELLVAVSLDIGASAAETLFSGTDKILIVDGNVWLPLSMSVINEGFMAAWAKGAAVLNDAFNSGSSVELAIIPDAWAAYPPAPLPELGKTVLRTDNAVVTRNVNNAVQTYITQEIDTIIQRTGSQASTAAQQNRLGILYVRAGRINEAKTAYERAAGMGSIPAMTNRGNLAISDKDYITAERWFRQTLQRDPENVSALRGLEKISGNN